MKTTIHSLITKSLLAAAAIPLLASSMLAKLPAPLINVDASGLAEETVAAPVANTNPHFPASGPSKWLFQGPPAESKFLAF